MKAKPVLILLFVAVFGLGVMTGLGVAMRWAPAAIEKRAWQVNFKERWKRMSAELQLTDEQRKRIKPMIIETMRAQRENMAEVRRAMRTLEEKIEFELTPEQRKQFKKFRREERREEHPGPHRDRMGPPPPEGDEKREKSKL